MDPTVALLTAYLATLAAVLTFALTSEAGRRQFNEQRTRGLTERAFADIIQEMGDRNHEVIKSMQGHLERMTTPQGDGYTTVHPTPQPDYVFGEAVDEVNQFHDTMGGRPVEDTPDWTDAMFPNERLDEPRVATVRPGDSIIPGQGNWDEMTAEGRTVANGGVVSGEDQWNQ